MTKKYKTVHTKHQLEIITYFVNCTKKLHNSHPNKRFNLYFDLRITDWSFVDEAQV